MALSRRELLGSAAGTLAAGALGAALPKFVFGQAQAATQPAAAILPASRAALVHGQERADNIFKALKLIEPDIRKALARKKRVLIKPNLVTPERPLTTSHADCIAAICEFFSPLVKEEIIIAESPAGATAADGFDKSGLYRLDKKYKLRFVDIDAEDATVFHVSDHRHRPQPVRVCKYLLDPDTYVVSSAVPKTHDRAILTLSLKNVVVGGLKKDPKAKWGRPETGLNDKFTSHGGPNNEAIHYNFFTLAKAVHPDLSVIDGFVGMEGNGPIVGTAVDHRIALASTDWLAADRVGVELMGFDFQQVGYLAFCARAGLGQSDLSRIELLGEPVARHIRKYRPHDNIEKQLKWMEDKS